MDVGRGTKNYVADINNIGIDRIDGERDIIIEVRWSAFPAICG